MTGTPSDRKAPVPSDDPKGSAPADSGSDDGPLDSIGKAITAPVRGAAEEEEPDPDAKRPPQAPG